MTDLPELATLRRETAPSTRDGLVVEGLTVVTEVRTPVVEHLFRAAPGQVLGWWNRPERAPSVRRFSAGAKGCASRQAGCASAASTS